MVIWIVVGVMLIGIVLLVVEGRIMHKPEAERSDRERGFMRADRAVGRAQQSYARNIAPWLVVAASLLGLLVTIPMWASGKTGQAVGLTVFFLVFGVGAVLLWAFVLRKRGRGSDWRAEQDRQTADADVAGRPRWFVSVRAGWLLGGGFTVLGIIALVTTGLSGSDPVAGLIMTAVGVLFLVLAVVQQRAEEKR